jgi:toxin ParE1/3/4
MRVNWSKRAFTDLDAIATYIERDDPSAAEHVARSIFDRITSLSSMPDRGRTGKAPGTRELLFSPWPYAAVFRIVNDEVRILRIRHTAQRWPAKS